MREYKFRAYDTYTKTMLPIVDIIKFTKSEDIYITRNGTYGVGINIQYQPSIEIMQYTGLKDKNGKEIYEGDILKAYDGRIQGEVIFDLRGLHFGIKMSEDENYTFSQNFLNSKDIEVIGNIYDNPELLEVQNENK